eukprot:CAMPEP_0179042810 /NCGR_PEP_ID=MMETSP0796-20121207/16849_1 /TAXON_ID=73915 /ORGANISM="Pyrodinium bahamense, Strain pbaha01" /LENGTH=487 /DNA_ID=CAMNT_0020739187 /DNA_START=74 /DNA_END=1537 /DNA_ORIENTATION=-
MAEETQAQGLSKSAKRRAAKKARENAGPDDDDEKTTSAPPSQPKAQAKAVHAKAASPPAAEAQAKAKAAPKVEAKAAPKAEPKAEPKAPAKAAAKPAAKAEGKAKAAAKPKAAPKPVEEEPPKREPSPERFVQLDDGTGGEWEVATALTKKQQKRKDRIDTEKAEAKALGVKPGQQPQYIPGMAPPPDAKAAAKAAPAASQAVTAIPAMAAATAAAAAEKEKAPESNTSTATIKVPEAKIGIVIGPKGSKIKLIQEKTEARIDTSGDLFTITGPPQGVSKAETAIRELIEKGYTAMEYEDFSENFVAVHPSCFPDLIGKGGIVIRKIKEELGVAVNIPEAPKNAPAGKKYKVTLAGSAAAVEKAKDVINDIIMYYHHPLTHPDLVHDEFEVADWSLRFIIGKAGSELRHIQNNFKVKMNIPRDHSANKNVVIVGEQFGVERARAYIDKVLWNAEHAPRGRDRADAAEDTWGDEEEEEAWMKDYMYKR